MDTYEIFMSEIAEKRLRKYNKEVQKRFAKKIEKLGTNPEIYGKPLRGSLHGYWELYFEGKFRIIFTIDFNNRLVNIVAIKHKDDF